MISSDALVETLASENSTETESYLIRIYLCFRFIKTFARPKTEKKLVFQFYEILSCHLAEETFGVL